MSATGELGDHPGELWFWWDLVRARSAAALHRVADGLTIRSAAE